MPHPKSPVGMLQRLDEVGMGLGQRKAQNQNLGTKSTRLLTKNINSSEDLTQQLRQCMIVRSIYRKKVKRFTGTKDILVQHHLRRWIKPCEEQSGVNHSPRKTKGEIGLSAKFEVLLNDRTR
jgi:hypothetical protein